MADKKTFEEAKFSCKAIGGEFFIPKTSEQFNDLTKLLDATPNCSNTLLLAGKKLKKNNIIDTNGRDISFHVWGFNQPNGRNIQQCITIKHETYKDDNIYVYNDVECSARECYSCFMNARSTFQLRGDLNTDIDNRFMGFLENGKLRLNGVSKSSFHLHNGNWSINNQLWSIGNIQTPPMGLKTWYPLKKDLKLTQVKLSYNNSFIEMLKNILETCP